MVDKRFKGSMDDWTVSDVWSNHWTYPEIRSVLTDLIFAPTDFFFGPTRITRKRIKQSKNVTHAAKQIQQPKRFDAVTALNKSFTPWKDVNYYQPQPSLLALQTFDITSDDDVWVERFHVDKRHHRLSYFCSYRTGRCVLSEPPTGAKRVVFRRDLDTAPEAIRMFAVQQLDHRSSKELAKLLSRAKKSGIK